jgi:hypothetical protein
MDIGFAKELYFRELEGKVQQDTRVGIYVGILTVVAGGLAFLIRGAWPGKTIPSLISLGFSFMSVVLYFLAVIWVLRAMRGYLHKKLPPAEELLDTWKKILEYYKVNAGVEGSAAGDFEEFLIERLVSATTRNDENNLKRSAHFWVVNGFLLWIIILSAISGLCLALNYFFPNFFAKGS